MLIISVRDNENNTWKRKAKNKDRKEQRCDKIYSESWRAEWFCSMLKLGFLQLICKASLILKQNVELTLSIMWVKACCGGV